MIAFIRLVIHKRQSNEDSMIRFRVLSSSVYTTIVIFVLIRIVFPSMGYYYFSACRSAWLLRLYFRTYFQLTP
jgi:hypothetical protein